MTTNQEFKVVFIGDTNVGKTSIIKRFSDHYFTNTQAPTVSSSYLQLKMTSKQREVVLNVWDTAGDERFHSVVPLFARSSDVVVMVFDITQNETFLAAQKWHSELIEEMGEIEVKILCANKCDLDSHAYTEQYKAWASSHNMSFILTSAMDGSNITELFQLIADKVCILAEKDTISTLDVTEKTRKPGKCC